MKKYLIALLLVGCTTPALNEPDRSEYYFACLSAKLLFTTCQCVEAAVIKKTGILGLSGADDETVSRFQSAVLAEMPACKEESAKLVGGSK